MAGILNLWPVVVFVLVLNMWISFSLIPAPYSPPFTYDEILDDWDWDVSSCASDNQLCSNEWLTG
jgi:hypothetical protein